MLDLSQGKQYNFKPKCQGKHLVLEPYFMHCILLYLFAIYHKNVITYIKVC